MRLSIPAILLSLTLSSVFGWQADGGWEDDHEMTQPALTMDLDHDGSEEQIYIISNLFVADVDSFYPAASGYKNKLYIVDGASGTTSVFEFSGVNFRIIISSAEEGDIRPFHDSIPDLLVYMNGRLEHFISYSQVEKQYKAFPVKIQPLNVLKVPEILRGENLEYFKSEYGGKERLFPFHFKNALVRAFHDGKVLKYFMYTQPRIRLTRWFRVHFGNPVSGKQIVSHGSTP